ncbi:MAG: allophanate hydrolase subunit 1 [Methylocystis sp.]
MTAPRYLDAGEAALSVEFGEVVDPEINARVLALDAALREAKVKGIQELVPTYRALMVHYEPLEISRAELVNTLESLALWGAAGFASKVRWHVPCCYDPALAEDILEAARLLGLTPERLAALHASTCYRAYMYGFAPGWCYLGGLPQSLALPRRASPRGPTPPGAVLIGGGLSLIAANPMPTGWYVIGRTPEKLFSLEREPPLLIDPGDAIDFEPIDTATFSALEARGGMVARREVLA